MARISTPGPAGPLALGRTRESHDEEGGEEMLPDELAEASAPDAAAEAAAEPAPPSIFERLTALQDRRASESRQLYVRFLHRLAAGETISDEQLLEFSTTCKTLEISEADTENDLAHLKRLAKFEPHYAEQVALAEKEYARAERAYREHHERAAPLIARDRELATILTNADQALRQARQLADDIAHSKAARPDLLLDAP